MFGNDDVSVSWDMLFDKYKDRIQKKILHKDWEVWSGHFNRHIRSEMIVSENNEAWAYVFGVWQSMNRMIKYSKNPLNPLALVNRRDEEKYLEVLIKKGQEAIDDIGK
jgi:hypothetical protein